MSERWKYQIKTGLSWGIYMAVFMALFDLTEMNFREAFISKHFIFRFVFFTLFYTLIFGYFQWKQKVKRDKIKKQ